VTPSERLDALERENQRLYAVLERLMAVAEALAGAKPQPQPESTPPRRPCRGPLPRRRTRGGGRGIQAP
jgi:hypothetical protein